MTGSDSSSGTPPDPRCFGTSSLVGQRRQRESSSSPTSSHSMASAAHVDTEAYYDERLPCWCARCQGTHRRMRRVCIEHVELYGECPNIPPLERQDQPMGIRSPQRPPISCLLQDDDSHEQEIDPSLLPRTRHSQAVFQLQLEVMQYSLPQGPQSEISDDRPLPDHLHAQIQTYDRRRYGGWIGPLPRDGEVFSFWGARYLIAPSTIPNSGRGLFIAQDLYVPRNSEVTLMSFCGPIYDWGPWHQLVHYLPSMTRYGLCLNAASLQQRGITHNEGMRKYIDGRPYIQGNIAGLINSSRRRNERTNCIFLECENGHEPNWMSRDVPSYIVVNATRSLRAGDELLVNYGWRRRPPV